MDRQRPYQTAQGFKNAIARASARMDRRDVLDTSGLGVTYVGYVLPVALWVSHLLGYDAHRELVPGLGKTSEGPTMSRKSETNGRSTQSADPIPSQRHLRRCRRRDFISGT